MPKRPKTITYHFNYPRFDRERGRGACGEMQSPTWCDQTVKHFVSDQKPLKSTSFLIPKYLWASSSHLLCAHNIVASSSHTTNPPAKNNMIHTVLSLKLSANIFFSCVRPRSHLFLFTFLSSVCFDVVFAQHRLQSDWVDWCRCVSESVPCAAVCEPGVIVVAIHTHTHKHETNITSLPFRHRAKQQHCTTFSYISLSHSYVPICFPSYSWFCCGLGLPIPTTNTEVSAMLIIRGEWQWVWGRR